MAEFKDRMKSLRFEKDVTLDDITKKIGITGAALSRYENGLRTPPINIAVMLAEYFNVSTDYLLGVSDIKAPFNNDDRVMEYVDGVVEGLKKRGYDYSGKPVDKLLEMIVDAIRINEVLKNRD